MLSATMDYSGIHTARLLFVIRNMAEDIIRHENPGSGCPVHGQSSMRRDSNGIRYCGVAGCGFEVVSGGEPTVSAIVARYLEKVDAGQRC